MFAILSLLQRKYSIGITSIAILAQLVERIHGKDEVISSILIDGSHNKKPLSGFLLCDPYKEANSFAFVQNRRPQCCELMNKRGGVESTYDLMRYDE